MIFADLGTPGVADPGKRGFSAYHWMRDELIRLGVPRCEIAFMQDHKTSEQKIKLFAAVNAGEVRVLIGSTETMGTGVNAQLRLLALHHLDVPWLPSDIEQREGRIVRQFNQNEEVRIYAYATQGSLDATMWQTNQRKASFIEAAMRGDTSIRAIEDVGESQASQFALAKALSSGDERLLTKAGLEGDIARLRRLRAAHVDDQVNIRREIAAAESTIVFTRTRIAAIDEDLARLEPTRGDHFKMEVRGTIHHERTAAGAALQAALDAVGLVTTPVRLGRIGGFEVVSTPVRSFFDGGAPTTCVALKRTRFDQEIEVPDAVSDLGLIARLEHALGAMAGNLAHHELQLASLERRLEGYRARLGQAFEFEEELLGKEAELAALDRALAAGSQADAPAAGAETAGRADEAA